MIASGLVYALNHEGYDVVYCQDVKSALEQIEKQPFRIRELLARVKRSLQKKKGKNQEVIRIGQASICTETGKVYVDNKQIEAIMKGQNGDIDVELGGNGKGAIFLLKFWIARRVRRLLNC